MNSQTKRLYSAVTQFIYIDQPSRPGRHLSLLAMSGAIALLCLLFVWFGMGRLHIIFANQAAHEFQARRYAAAEQAYTRALRFDGSDSNALLTRGYARQQLGD